jgi:hypothetical protein
MKNTYLYDGIAAEAESAAGAKGVLLRTLHGTIVFRVYGEAHEFTDYEIRHDDLTVTIGPDALAAFYKVGERHVLDHSPEVLGLRRTSQSA